MKWIRPSTIKAAISFIVFAFVFGISAVTQSVAEENIITVQVAPINRGQNSENSTSGQFSDIGKALAFGLNKGAACNDSCEVLISVHSGIYHLKSPLRIRREDVGKNVKSLKFIGDGQDTVRVTGSTYLGKLGDSKAVPRREARANGFRDSDYTLRYFELNGIDDLLHAEDWFIRGAGVAGRNSSPPELVIADRLQRLVRWPEQGWSTIRDLPPVQRSTHERLGSNHSFIAELPQASNWSREGMWARGYFYWDWYDEIFPITLELGSQTRLTLNGTPAYGIKPGSRFVILNQRAELDLPGEFFLDRDDNRVYFLASDEDASNGSDVWISSLKAPILTLDRVSDVLIEGITFQDGRGVAIDIRGGSGVTIKRCTIKRFGDAGLLVRGGQGHLLKTSTVEDIGGAGVVVAGGDRVSLRGSAHRIEDSKVRNVGRFFSARNPAVVIGGVGVQVSGNELFDVPDTAIRIAGNDHVINRNKIRNACSDAADCGAIYMGRDWTTQGNVILENSITDLKGAYAGASVMAVYLDDFSSNAKVEGNYVRNVFRGVLIGGGRDNTVMNNYFENVKIPISADSRGLHWARKFLGKEGVLETRLRAVPYRGKLWASRYPALVEILSDEPALPKRNSVRNNALINCGELKIDPIAHLYGTFNSNVHIESRQSEQGEYLAGQRISDSKIRAVIPEWKGLSIFSWTSADEE